MESSYLGRNDKQPVRECASSVADILYPTENVDGYAF